MQINKILFYSFILIVSIVFQGCMDDNSNSLTDTNNSISVNADTNKIVDSNGSLNVETSVVLPVSTKEIRYNNEQVNIRIRVIDEKNNPCSNGNVKIIYPDDVRDGRDIGYFTSSGVKLINGIANFTYYAPSNLDTNTTDINFNFYHDLNPSSSKPYTFKLNPEVNQTVLSTYSISIANDTDNRMSLESSKTLSFFIKNENNETLEDKYIQSITVTSLNPSLGVLEDTLGNNGNTLSIKNKNNISVNIKSNKISGLIPIKVSTFFIDANGQNATLDNIFNVLVLSGPPSAMSLSYAGTEHDGKYAKFIENWVLTVTDKYNNRVNTNSLVSMGLIAGYAKDSGVAGDKYLFYQPSTGGVLKDRVFTNDVFEAKSNVFDNVDQENDTLALFGNGYTYDGSGKWDFYEHNSSALELIDDYNGSDIANLGFAVGNNYRQDRNHEGVEWVANVYPENNNYILDEMGRMIIKIEYDYYLTGKDIVLWTNLVGYKQDSKEILRIGEAKKITLRAQGIEPIPASVSIDKNTTESISVNFMIKNTREFYRNARMSYRIKTKSAEIINIIDTNSNTENNIANISIIAEAAEKDAGTVSIEDVLIVNEF